jgi:hypothetical protein
MKEVSSKIIYYASIAWMLICIYILFKSDILYIIQNGRYSALLPVGYFSYTFPSLIAFLISTLIDPRRARIVGFIVLYLLPAVVFLVCRPYFSGDFLN